MRFIKIMSDKKLKAILLFIKILMNISSVTIIYLAVIMSLKAIILPVLITYILLFMFISVVDDIHDCFIERRSNLYKPDLKFIEK